MLNTVNLIGRLVRDPEIGRTQSGVDYASLRIAVDRDYKQGDTRPTDFFTVVCWRAQANFARQYFSKSQKIAVCGRLISREYTKQDGKTGYTVEIQADNLYFVDSKAKSDNNDLFDTVEGLPEYA